MTSVSGTAERDAVEKHQPVADGPVADVLMRWWGFETLRPLQAEAIDASLAGRD